jgi:hypothetical protein
VRASVRVGQGARVGMRASVRGARCVRAFRLACAHPRKGADGVGKGAGLANWPPLARWVLTGRRFVLYGAGVVS